MELITRDQFLKNKKKKAKDSLEAIKKSNLTKCIKKINSGILFSEVSNKKEVQDFLKRELGKYGWGVVFYSKPVEQRSGSKYRKESRHWAKFGDIEE